MDTPLKARSDRYRMILVIPLSALCGFTSYTLWLIVNRYLFITDDPDVWNVIHKVLGHVIAVYVSFIVAGRVAPVYRFDFAYKMIAWSVVLVSVVSIFQGVLRCIVYGNLRLDLDIAIYTVVNIVVALYVYTNRNISPGNKKINGWIKNEQDGSVSIYARSDKKTLDFFQIRLKNIKHNLGPNVQELTVLNKNSSPIDKTIIGFQIKY